MESPSELLTPSPLTEIDLPSPLMPYSPELGSIFDFDLEGILDLSPTEDKPAQLGLLETSSNSTALEAAQTTEDSTIDPDSFLQKEVKLENTEDQQASIKADSPSYKEESIKEEVQLRPQSPTRVPCRSNRKRTCKQQPPTPILPQKAVRSCPQRPVAQVQRPSLVHYRPFPIHSYPPQFNPIPLLHLQVQPTPDFIPKLVGFRAIAPKQGPPLGTPQ